MQHLAGRLFVAGWRDDHPASLDSGGKWDAQY